MRFLSSALRRAFIGACSVLLTASGAFALPAVGSPMPTLTVQSIANVTVNFSPAGSQPILILGSGRRERDVHNDLKSDLDKLRKQGKLPGGLEVVVLVDLTSYDYWPAKPAAENALRSEQKKTPVKLIPDFSGKRREPFDLKSGVAATLLYVRDAQGKLSLRFRHEGELSPATRAQLVALLPAP